MPEESGYDLNELCALAGVTPRTVRYYIQQGLLAGPSSRGPAARYTAGHLDRLRLIGLLRDDDMPLSRIRQTLEGLDDAAVAAMLQASATPPQGSALDYIRSLSQPQTTDVAHSVPADPHTTLQHRRAWSARAAELGGRGSVRGEASQPGEWRSQWERISITPDVELHVRRPLSRKNARAVDRLTQVARDLFRGESHES